MPDRGQHVSELAALGPVVVDVVGHHHRQPQLAGQVRRLRDEPVVVGQQVVRQLEHEPAGHRRIAPTEQVRVPLRERPRTLPIARPQSPGQLALPAARQRDQPLRVLRQQRLGEPRDRLRAGEVRPRHHPAQAPPARRVAGQQHEVRSALRLPDPPVILLHDRAVTRQPGTVGPGPGGPAGDDDRRLDDHRRPPTRPPRAPRRDDDPGRIRHGGIGQLDLDPDHRVQAGRLRGGREPDSAVQALVVGDRQPGEAELDGPRDEIVRCRGPVEEREMAVAVQLGVGGIDHATVSGGRVRDDRTDVRLGARRSLPDRRLWTQPNRPVARLMAVIAPLVLHPGRRLALELLLRAAAIALAAVVILGLLPTLAEAVG